MLKRISQSVIAGVAAKCIYDKGYEAGQNSRHHFFNNLQDKALQKIEGMIPPEERFNFRRAVNEVKHEVHQAKNEVRRSIGLGPK